MLWLKATAFVLVVQLGVVGVLPFFMVDFLPRAAWGSWRLIGIAPVAVGALTLLWCNVAFVTRGRGTAAPYDPPRDLVVAGLYRHVRNPQYVSAILIVLGEATLSGALILFAYGLVLAVAYHLFVMRYEEPRLRALFGQSYIRYSAMVPRWVPRFRAAAF